MERSGLVHKENIFSSETTSTTAGPCAVDLGTVLCVFFLPFCRVRAFSGFWRAHSFLPVRTKLLPYSLKRSTKCGGRLFKCLYPYILPWACLQLNLVSKAPPKQSCGHCAKFYQTHRGVPSVWIQFQRGDGEYVWHFGRRAVRGTASWALRGLNLRSQSHNSLLTAAHICHVAPSPMNADVFSSGRTFWFILSPTAGLGVHF